MKKSSPNFGLIFLLLLTLGLNPFFSCTEKEKTPSPIFTHDINSDKTPWTKEAFDNDSEKFSFAVHSDLTGGERPRIYEVAVAQLNLMRPELIVNVGDLIEGGALDSASWAQQWDSFDSRTEAAKAPVFYTGGNHDLTGNFAQGIWKERYGKNYYHFIYEHPVSNSG
jgi:hypothetical protein